MKQSSPRTRSCWFVLLAWWAISVGPASAENWPRFRGPNGTGISDEKGFPTTWSDKDYAWKTRIPGLGHSSPCVWDDHVFVTSAENEGRQRLVVDVSAATGEIRWIKRIAAETDQLNQRNSYASATPATDGERVYVAFASDAAYWLLAYDFTGRQVWKYDLGPFLSQHGAAVSPVVFEDLVVLGNDQDGKSSIVAVDSKTGKRRWSVPRNQRGIDKAATYATPILLARDGGTPELIFTSQADGVTSYDPRTGRLNWQLADIFEHRACGSPVAGHGLLFATCGGGGQGKFMAAVRLGGTGQLDDSYVAWTRDRQLPYVPTPIVHGDHVYLWGDNGVVSSVVARTGENVWTHRVERTIYSGSPICVDGKLYCTTEEGEVIVLAASPEFRELGRSSIGERSHATPAVANGRMFIRGFEHLFCIDAKAEATAGR